MIPAINTSLASALSQTAPASKPSTLGDTSGGGFGDVFQAAFHQVDDLQAGADQQVGTLLHGGGAADVGGVMASVEKADIAFQLMMQVRNKIVSAYQDIEKMQF